MVFDLLDITFDMTDLGLHLVHVIIEIGQPHSAANGSPEDR